jgi:hypothetical protein
MKASPGDGKATRSAAAARTGGDGGGSGRTLNRDTKVAVGGGRVRSRRFAVVS